MPLETCILHICDILIFCLENIGCVAITIDFTATVRLNSKFRVVFDHFYDLRDYY